MDSLTVSLAAFSGLVATAFALITADRWHRRRLTHHGAWAMAMLLFAVGAFALWWATTAGWSSGVFRVFFTTGAVLNVAWLALGSIALLSGDRLAIPIARILALISAFAVGVMLVIPETAAFSSTEFPRARDHFGWLPRTMAAIGSGIPAIVIIAGAVWSAVRLIRGRRPASRATKRSIGSSPERLVVSNLCIALGTVVLSASGSLAGRLGEERAFTVTLSVGVLILFIGFMIPGSRMTSAAARAHLSH